MANVFLVVLVILHQICAVSTNDLPLVSTPISSNTEFVIFGTRHGNRNPEQYLSGIQRTWGQEGFLELTSIGKRQGYGLGVELRKFIGNLTSDNYNASEVKYYSSSSNRCQMTLQVAMAGLHPPQTYSEWNTRKFDDWSPIPYTISDPILRMYAVPSCKRSDQVWAPVTNDQLPELENLKRDNAQLLSYLGQQTGWNMSDLSNMADLADNVIQMDFYNTSYPQFLATPQLNGFNESSMKTSILQFAEIHPRACASDYYPCRFLMGGYWLNDILDKLSDANSTKNPLKVVGYASHTEVTLSVMKLMGIEKDEVTTSAGFVIEFRRRPYAAIRILNHDPNPIDNHVIYPAVLTKELSDVQESDGFIRLADFIRIVKLESYTDWPQQCDAPSCAKDDPTRSFPSSSSNKFGLISLIMMIISINYV